MNTGTEEQKGMNRRQFLLVSSSATFALIMHQSIVSISEVQASREFIESTCRTDGKMTQRVLIAYASRCGSTGSVAEAIGEVLCGVGVSVDVRLVENVKNIGPYQAVIVGSAVRRGKWLPEATAFVKSSQDTLSRLPVAYFVVCLTMKDDSQQYRDKVLAYLDPVRKDAPMVKPTAVGLFPGVLDFSRLSFVQRAYFKAKGVSEGDYRNLPAVKGWASDVSPAIVAAKTRG